MAYGDPDREGQSFGGRHRIRVVSGYARNLNTGENSLTGTVHRKAKVAVHRSAEFPSFVEFSSVTGVGRQ